jgi:hypothetical protein
MPSFKGNKTPYLNSDTKKLAKSIYRADFADGILTNYIPEDTKFQLPCAVKSREGNKINSERQTEQYLCS